MSISNHPINPGDKRAGGRDDTLVRKKPCLSTSTHLERLPFDVKEIVVNYFSERQDLKNLSEVSKDWQNAVLRKINLQNEIAAVKELQVLSEMHSSGQRDLSSAVEFLKDYFAKIRNPDAFHHSQDAQIDDNKLQELQQKITALATTLTAKRFRILKLECYQDIIKGDSSIAILDAKYFSLKCALVTEAFEMIFASSSKPDQLRDWAISHAALSGCLPILKALLANGAGISLNRIGSLVEMAARKGHLAVVEFLFADGALVLQEDKVFALIKAAKNGHVAVVRFLLENLVPISEKDRGSAVKVAAKNGQLPVVQLLLADGAAVSEADRGEAIQHAAQKGYLEVVEFLLASGGISEQDRGRAVRWAASLGRCAILQALLTSGEISQQDRGWAVLNAAESGYLDVLEALLANREISEADRSQAVLRALAKGHVAVQDFLLANWEASEANRYWNVENNSQDERDSLADFLRQN